MGKLLESTGCGASLPDMNGKMVGGENCIDATIHHAWNNMVMEAGIKEHVVRLTYVTSIGTDRELRIIRRIEVGL